ncbi:MAG: HAD family phosphatase [Candidatus Wildermuthbacteria bacterium]|nr:HAD family phosphatase [Candidatus Wildermuthbacteria bacterium]
MVILSADPSIRYILVDLDGTTFPTEGPLPEDFYEHLSIFSQLIERANRGEFPKIGFCTGRELNYVEGATRTLTLPDGWSVLENGLFIYNLATGARVNHPLLTPEVRAVFQKIRERMWIIAYRFPDLEAYLKKEVHVALERRNRWINLAEYVAPIEEILIEFKEQMDVVCSGHAIDLLVKGINKGSGLQELCDWSGISPEEVLIIGDSPNDFPAMELAGSIGCPSNADKGCKEFVRNKGGHVSLLPYVVGVVDIIRHYLPNARQA